MSESKSSNKRFKASNLILEKEHTPVKKNVSREKSIKTESTKLSKSKTSSEKPTVVVETEKHI